MKTKRFSQGFVLQWCPGILIIAVIAACVGLTEPLAHGRIVVKKGDTNEVMKLQDLLQCGAFTGSPPAGVVSIDTNGVVTMTGTPTNEFGQRLKQIIDDTNNTVEVYIEMVGPNGRPILIGGFGRGQDPTLPGNGKQSLDVSDLMLMPKTNNTGTVNMQAALIHELIEAWDGLKNSNSVSQAHLLGVAVEEAVIKEFNMGMEFKRDGEEWVPPNMFKFHYKKTATGERRQIKFTSDPSQNHRLTNVTPGFVVNFRTEYLFNGRTGGGLGRLAIYDDHNETNALPDSLELGFVDYLITDDSDRLFCSLSFQEKVVRLNRKGQIEQTYTHPDLSFPTGLAFNSLSNELYVAADDKIVVFADSGAHLRTLTGLSLSLPAGLALDLDGNLFIANHGAGNVLRVTPGGALLNTITNVNLTSPAGIAFAASVGELFVVDNSGNTVFVFTATGQFKRTFGSAPQLQSPWGLALDGGMLDQRFGASFEHLPLQRVLVASSGTLRLVSYRPDGSLEVERPVPAPSLSAVAVRIISVNPPQLNIQPERPNVLLSWTGDGELETTTLLLTNWTRITNATNPHPYPATGLQRFFRVSADP